MGSWAGAGEGFERLIHRRSELRSELDQSIICACPSVRILEQNRLYRFAGSQFGARVSLLPRGSLSPDWSWRPREHTTKKLDCERHEIDRRIEANSRSVDSVPFRLDKRWAL